MMCVLSCCAILNFVVSFLMFEAYVLCTSASLDSWVRVREGFSGSVSVASSSIIACCFVVSALYLVARSLGIVCSPYFVVIVV